MSTITHLKWPFHCDCKVVFSPGISSFTNQYLIAYPALFSCLLGKQLFPNHLWGNSFCFFWTKIRKRTQTLFSSKWGKYKHMTAKTLSHLLLKSQYFYQFNRASFIIFIISLIAMIKKKTYEKTIFTPPLRPLSNVPFPLPPAKTCAFITTSFEPRRKTLLLDTKHGAAHNTQHFAIKHTHLAILLNIVNLRSIYSQCRKTRHSVHIDFLD